MAKTQENLGKTELDILKVIWEKQPCSVLDVAEVMARQRGHARTTVLTVMQRLMKKGFLKREKQKGVWMYESTSSEKKVMGNLLQQFVSNFFEGSSTSLVQHLADSPMDQEELKQIREILNGQKTTEGEVS